MGRMASVYRMCWNLIWSFGQTNLGRELFPFGTPPEISSTLLHTRNIPWQRVDHEATSTEAGTLFRHGSVAIQPSVFFTVFTSFYEVPPWSLVLCLRKFQVVISSQGLLHHRSRHANFLYLRALFPLLQSPLTNYLLVCSH